MRNSNDGLATAIMRRPQGVLGSDVQMVMTSGELRGEGIAKSACTGKVYRLGECRARSIDASTAGARHNGVCRKDSRCIFSTYTGDKGLVNTNHMKLRTLQLLGAIQ